MVHHLSPVLRRCFRAFLLGGLVAAGSRAGPHRGPPLLVGDFSPRDEVGILRNGPEGRELARREGWVPEEVIPLRGGLGTLELVVWKSFPRRLWTRPELWRSLGDVTRRVWPPGDRDLDWYQADFEVRAFKGQDRLVFRRAVVPESFEAPHLRVRETFGFRAGTFRSLGKSYAPAQTPSQVLNLVAALLADGEPEAARRAAAAVPEEALSERERVTLLLGIPETGEAGEQARRELLDIANRRGAAALEAADMLLQWKTKEAARAP